MAENEWKLNINEVASGPFSETEIRQKYFAKTIPQDTYVWRPGLKEWIPISESGILSTDVTSGEGMLNPNHGKAAPHQTQADNARFLTRWAGAFIDAGIMILSCIPLAIFMPKFVGIINWVVAIYYFIFYQAKTGQTIGKKTMRIRVVRLDFGPVTPRIMVIRYLTTVISALPFCAGYLWTFVDAKKRTWHDIFAGTQVVYDDGNIQIQNSDKHSDAA